MIEKPPRVVPASLIADGKPNGNGNHNVIRETRPRAKESIRLGIVGSILILAIPAFISSWIQKWLWTRQFNYAGIFWTLLTARWGPFCEAFVVALLYLWINLHLAVKNGAAFGVGGLTGESSIATRLGVQISRTVVKGAMGAMAVVAALFLAVTFYAK